MIWVRDDTVDRGWETIFVFFPVPLEVIDTGNDPTYNKKVKIAWLSTVEERTIQIYNHGDVKIYREIYSKWEPEYIKTGSIGKNPPKKL